MTEPSSQADAGEHPHDLVPQPDQDAQPQRTGTGAVQLTEMRSEEHTSELQSQR